MKIADSVAFVTGANRGIGLVFAQELLASGARKVYAAARNPERITLDGVNRIALDVTKPRYDRRREPVHRFQLADQQRWNCPVDRLPGTRLR
jgi:NAD(P)-dependent dehydrogenase (short-subunit alcohol dehydrogenase family)